MGYKVIYFGNREAETIDADRYKQNGDWFEFEKFRAASPPALGGSHKQVLSVRVNDVDRIEQVG